MATVVHIDKRPPSGPVTQVAHHLPKGTWFYGRLSQGGAERLMVATVAGTMDIENAEVSSFEAFRYIFDYRPVSRVNVSVDL